MSSTNSTNPPLNTYAASWGPPLISTFIAAVIYGITVLQTFYYYRHYGHRDRASWLIFVGTIFVLDTAALALFMYCMYYYLVLSWGIPDMLLPDVKEFPMEYVITSVLTFIVQLFFINTIRALRAPIVVPIFLFLTALAAFGSGLILPAVQLQLKLVPVIVVSWLNHAAFNIARSTALACDLGIVAALCWLLESRKTDIRRANSVIDGIMMFAVQRGILQALIQGGEVISYAVAPSSVLFLPFHVIVSRIYCTSVLATLNSREYVLSRGRSPQRHPTTQFVAAPPPDAGERDNAAAVSREGLWASIVGTSGPVLSSYLDPPFLFSHSSRELKAGASTSADPSHNLRGVKSFTHSGERSGLESAGDSEPVSPHGSMGHDPEKSPLDVESEIAISSLRNVD